MASMLTVNSATELINACFSFSFFMATIIMGTINRNAKSKTGIYKYQCCSAARPSFISWLGNTTKMVVNVKCNSNTPAFKRANCGCLISFLISLKLASVSPLGALLTALGTKNVIIKIPHTASIAVSQKTPATPHDAATIGPNNIAKAKLMPMLIPITAITLGRCSSRLKSLANASKALAIAPMPCNARPTVTIWIDSANAAMTEPIANTTKPPIITFLRPILSDKRPIGICNTACVRPYAPIAKPIQIGEKPSSD